MRERGERERRRDKSEKYMSRENDLNVSGVRCPPNFIRIETRLSKLKHALLEKVDHFIRCTSPLLLEN